MIDRELYLAVGGLDWHNFPAVMSMADFSLKVAGAGKRIVYTPYARIHTGARLVNQQQTAEVDSCPDEEKLRFADKWGQDLQRLDRFYNVEVLGDNGIDEDRFKSWLCRADQGA